MWLCTSGASADRDKKHRMLKAASGGTAHSSGAMRCHPPESAELKGLLDDLYRPNAKVGSGSTADAVRYEKATGELVGGKSHMQKAKDYVNALKNWLKRNPDASLGDRKAVEDVIADLEDAIGETANK